MAQPKYRWRYAGTTSRTPFHVVLTAAIGALAGVPVDACAAAEPGRPRIAQIAPKEGELAAYAGLHEAAAKGDIATIVRLIAAGAKPDVQDARSRTPLHVAAYFGQHEAARTLIRLGANPNALERQRYDILAIAAANDDLDMLNIALAAGADPRAIRGPYDNTALITAAQHGNVAIVRALIAARAPLDHINNLGFTALSQAIVFGNGSPNHIATVLVLVRAGADVNITDRQGLTALAHARNRHYAEIVDILEGAEPRPVRGP